MCFVVRVVRMTRTKRKTDNTGRPPLKRPPKRRKRDIRQRKPGPSNDDKARQTRADTGQRMRTNVASEFTCVKASFRGRFASGCSPDVRKILLDLVDTYVRSMSQMMVRGSMIANDSILEYMRQDRLPDLSNPTFFRNCITGRSKNEIISGVLQREFSAHPLISEPRGMCWIINYAANLYYTNFDNHLWMPFERRFKRYVKDWIQVNDVDESLIGVIINRILGRPHHLPIVLQHHVWDFIDGERTLLGNPTNFFAEGAQLAVLLKYTFRMLEFKRVHQLSGGFSIAPLHKVRRYHVTVDSSVLYDMIQEVFMRLGEEAPEWIQHVGTLDIRQAIDEYREMMWSNLFNWEGLSRRKFHNRVLTDGVQASFAFSRPKRKSFPDKPVVKVAEYVEKMEKRGLLDDLRIIAIDPGRANLVTAHDRQNNQFFSFTRRGYYQSIRRSLETVCRWENEIQDINLELSEFSLRTSNKELCRGYRQVYFKHYERLWASRAHVRRSKEAFHTHSTKQSILDRFFMSFRTKNQPKPVIFYGAASLRSHRTRGEMSVPVKKMLEICKRFYPTFLVNEHLTTQCHSQCGSRMHPVKNPVDRNAVRGIKFCSTCNEFVNRDRDACKSIYDAGISVIRPSYLSFTRPYEYKPPMVLLPVKRCKRVQ